ncbi:MAG: nitrous oxide reductase accessory protein NosL [Sulfurihydrogenibium sp.]
MLGKIFVVLFVFALTVFGQPKELLKAERCPVCGMTVNPNDKMLSQVKLKEGSYKFAESPKHILKFYFENKDKVSEIWVRDYQSGKWIDGKTAYYVEIQDGPMGPDLAAFSSKMEALKFAKGKKVYSFKDITKDLIDKLDTYHH